MTHNLLWDVVELKENNMYGASCKYHCTGCPLIFESYVTMSEQEWHENIKDDLKKEFISRLEKSESDKKKLLMTCDQYIIYKAMGGGRKR